MSVVIIKMQIFEFIQRNSIYICSYVFFMFLLFINTYKKNYDVKKSTINDIKLQNNIKLQNKFISKLKTYPIIDIHVNNNRNEIDNEYIQYAKYFSNNYDIYSRLVEINGNILQYASYEIKNNRNICVKAVSTDITSFKYVSDDLKLDILFLFHIIDLNPLYILENLTNSELNNISNNNTIMIRAIMYDKRSVYYANVILQNIYYLQNFIGIDYDYNKIKAKMWNDNGIGNELLSYVYNPNNIHKWKDWKLDEFEHITWYKEKLEK